MHCGFWKEEDDEYCDDISVILVAAAELAAQGWSERVRVVKIHFICAKKVTHSCFFCSPTLVIGIQDPLFCTPSWAEVPAFQKTAAPPAPDDSCFGGMVEFA